VVEPGRVLASADAIDFADAWRRYLPVHSAT
jgi:hypothetical protein